MITQLIDALNEYKIEKNDELVRIATGKYEYPNTLSKFFKKIKEYFNGR